MGNLRSKYTDEEWDELEGRVLVRHLTPDECYKRKEIMESTTNAYYLTVNGKAARLGKGNAVPSDCVYYDDTSHNVYTRDKELIGFGKILELIFK